MSVYLIKTVEIKKLHGIVWGNLDQIWDALYEMDQPQLFEYAKFKPGGLLSPSGIEPAKMKETDCTIPTPLANGGFLLVAMEPSERTFDDTLVKHGTVSRNFADLNACKGVEI